MNTLLYQLQNLFTAMRVNAYPALLVIGLLWGIQIINALLAYRLNRWGIYPRHIIGLRGIICAPFLHGSATHLFFNSIPLFVLLNFMLLQGTTACATLTTYMILISGGLLWLFGRKGLHIGASSLIMAYFSYLLIEAVQHPSVATIILAVLCLYYFGSLLGSIFPAEERMSWEGHLFGLIAGIATFFIA